MRIRKQELGTSNIIGALVEQFRKERGMKQKELLAQLQTRGIDLPASGLSKLEGQLRAVSDSEVVALAEIFGISTDQLLGRGKTNGK